MATVMIAHDLASLGASAMDPRELDRLVKVCASLGRIGAAEIRPHFPKLSLGRQLGMPLRTVHEIFLPLAEYRNR